MEPKTPPGEVTRLLQALGAGDRNAGDRLVYLVYGELRRLAGYYMANETPGRSLQPTALVHEAYIRLVHQDRVNWQCRAQFFAIAAQLMRRVLADRGRRRKRLKRAGDQRRVLFEDAAMAAAPDPGLDQFVDLDDALKRLAKTEPRQSRVVELRFYGGLTVEDTAGLLGISAKTVERDWALAKACLEVELSGRGSGRGA